MRREYTIKGVKIKSLLSDCTHKDLWMQLDDLLEALDETPKPKRWRIFKTPNKYWRYEESDGGYIVFKTREGARKHAFNMESSRKTNI